MNYREALAWLYGTQLFGIKLGLDSMRRLLAALDVPGKQQRIIHVAGTNGKGSVCAMIESVARAQGYRTGLFTSPHLVTFRERIQVSGEMIGKSEVAAGLTKIRELVESWDPHPTFFEIATALGLDHFCRERCDLVVLETGMGGRLDATNAVTPVASVITPIDFDHQKWLGNTLAEIAAEKAGIIKRGVPAVSAPQPAEAEAVLRNWAGDCQTTLEFIPSPNETPPVALAGAHQKQNAAVALAALRVAGVAVSATSINEGLATVKWPARFQQWSARIVIDGAHNPAGARTLVATWRDAYVDEQATVVLAVLSDKDATGIVEALQPIASGFVLPHARSERAFPPDELAELIRAVVPSTAVVIAANFESAMRVANARPQRMLITGSLHFAGEALAVLDGNPDDLEDCLQ